MLAALKKSRELQTLLLIVLGGLILRLWGIDHGFPFIFHPDEPTVVRSATGIRFEANPKHFDWPHLHFYLNYVLYWVFIKFRGLLQVLGFQNAIAAKIPLFWQDPLVFYWLSRVFNAFLGATTAIPLFLAGKKLFSPRVGLLAALALVLMPLHVHTSHFALIDIPTAFWISWALFFTVCAFKSNGSSENWKNYVLAGLFVGFAASTKYHGGLAAVAVLATFALSGKWLSNAKNLALSALASIFGFLIGTPYALFDFDTFVRTDSPVGALWQFKNVGSVAFMERLQQFFGVLSFAFAEEFGYVFIALFLIFVAYSTVKRRKENWLILIPALFLFFYLAGFDKIRSHYFLVTYPFIAFAAAAALDQIVLPLLKNRKLRLAVLLTIFSIPLYFSFQRSQILAMKDTRVSLYEWLQQNATYDSFMVYNSSSIEPVVGKISKDLSEKGLKMENIEGRRGFIIVYTDSEEGIDEEEAEFIEMFERVHEIRPNGRRGDTILIYAFDKTQAI